MENKRARAEIATTVTPALPSQHNTSMEEHKPEFISRSVALSKSYGSRSPWHGMDLHTTAPSTNRRAIYTPPPPSSPAATPTIASPQPATNNTNKIQTNDTALSARNLVIRRKLSERKRFDSADYAMKTVMQAMHAPGPAEGGEEKETAAPPPAVSPPQMPSTPLTMNSPSHARMGMSVFKDALKGGQREATQDDEPMLEQPLSPPAGSARQRPVQASPQPQQSSSASRYGAIGPVGMSAAGAMSARNIMIQKKMHEKRHFDSADWQLAQYGVQTDAAMDKPVEAPPVNRTPSLMQWNADAMASPTSSPSAVRAAVMRNAHLYAQMSPSVRSSTDEMQRQAAATESTPDVSKYAGLSGSNELLQRRLAEKKRFDSADYHMGARAARATSSTDGQQLRRAALLRQQQQNYSARHQTMAAPLANFLGAPSTGVAAPPAPMVEQQTPLAVAADAAAGTSKYGKLCAANVLLRKKLKERKRFDSADYHMERAKHQDSNASMGSESPDNDGAGSSSPVMNPQAKHIKLSEGAAPSRWASHATVVAMRQSGTSPSPNGVTREASAATPVSLEGRLAARSVLIHRHLAERKRFDSADHFAAKAEAIRARRDGCS